jgi:predicted GNAT family acetyltransferase
MSIEVTRNDELSHFEIHLDGELAGFAEFRIRGNTMVFPHTVIDPKFGGKGLGGTLVAYALDEASMKKLNVAPYCPFVAKIIAKDPDKYLFLVPESERAKFQLS